MFLICLSSNFYEKKIQKYKVEFRKSNNIIENFIDDPLKNG